MANDTRVRTNFVAGALSATFALASTTMNSAGLADLPAIGATEHAALELFTRDASGRVTKKEIVWVTAHTAAATSATVLRGREGTTAQDWASGDKWVLSPVVSDTDVVCTSATRPASPFIPMRIYETDTGKWLYWNGFAWMSMPQSAAKLGYALQTANQTVVGSGYTLLTGLSSAVVVPAGRLLRVSLFACVSPVSAGVMEAQILMDGVKVQRWYDSSVAAGEIQTPIATVVVSPTAGSHVFAATIALQGGGTVYASAADPSVLLVEDITGDPAAVLPGSVPVGVLAQANITATQGPGTTVTITPSLNVTVIGGRTLKVRCEVYLQNSTAPVTGRLHIQQDGVQIAQSDVRLTAAAVPERMECEVLISPTAGAHVYTAYFDNAGLGGSISLIAGADYPSTFYVEDITPTPAPSSGAPGSTLGYAQVVADQTGITTVTDLVGLSVTVTVPAGRRLRIRGQALVGRTVTDGVTAGFIQEGSTILARWFQQQHPNTSDIWGSGDVVISPSAGTHTYKLTLERSTGTGTVRIGAGATFPAYILVEDITGSVWPEGSEVTAGMVASEAWIPYTPTNTNVTVGNGTQVAVYQRIGRLVVVRYSLTFGSTTAFTGNVRIGLPVTCIGSIGVRGVYNDSGTRYYIAGGAPGTADNAELIHTEAGNFGVVNATNPFTWVTGDTVGLVITYEAAA